VTTRRSRYARVIGHGEAVMPEQPVDVYADQLQATFGPFGTTLNFGASLAIQTAGGIPQGQPVATVRMSLEHLKVMVFLLRRQLLEYERESGIRITIPMDVLNQLRVGKEDWQACWGANDR
jgi:hypothetical protein